LPGEVKVAIAIRMWVVLVTTHWAISILTIKCHTVVISISFYPLDLAWDLA
jgi:hypothetical protein